jgi:hypothetical protein
MTGMLDTITPKSDQLNADDLVGGRTLTIRVTKVDIGMAEQPVSVHFEGDNGKPYKPGKSMRRIMVHIWGEDANLYAGRQMTLYRDDGVKFGADPVGGIRISHMSHLDRVTTVALTETKAKRKPFTVRPLVTQQEKAPTVTLADWIATTLPGFIAECQSAGDLNKLTASRVYTAALGKATDEQKAEMQALIGKRMGRFVAPPTDTPTEDPEATALITALHELTTDAAVVKWRFGAEVKRQLADLQSRAPAEFDRVEAAVAAHKAALNNPAP